MMLTLYYAKIWPLRLANNIINFKQLSSWKSLKALRYKPSTK